MNVFPFIEAEEVSDHGTVNRSCELLEVSRSAFYDWHKHIPSRSELDDAELTDKISQIHAMSKGTYGAPRVHKELRDQRVHVGKKRVARLMARAGLVGRCPRRWRKTTIADPAAESRAVDLIRRAFGPGLELDRRWCGDITYIRTWEGWAYLATVIDLASRRVVGWALADHAHRPRRRRAAHGVSATATRRRRHLPLRPRLPIHQRRLRRPRRHVVGRRKGECWDCAVADSFFATIKSELIDTRGWPTIAGVHRAVFDYIEGWYNTRRLHSSLGYRSPARYEATIHQETAASAA